MPSLPVENHHTALASYAQAWPAEIASIVEKQLAQQTAPGDVRSIIVSVAPGGLTLGVWLPVEWEDHPSSDDVSTAVGFVALTPWLDRVDAVAAGELRLPKPAGWAPRTPLRFQDPVRQSSFEALWLELHRVLVATAIELATKHLATRFKQPVGVFVSMNGEEASLVAFCDAMGAPVYPLKENRRELGFSSLYPTASIVGDVMSIFYPEGQTKSKAPVGSIRRWRRDEIEAATDDDRRMKLSFRGEPAPVEFAAGHTREEHGGATKAEVSQALRQFVGRALLEAGARSVAMPPTAEAFVAALDAAGDRPGALIQHLVSAHGLGAVSEGVKQLTLPAKRLHAVHAAMSSVAHGRGAWPLSLEHAAAAGETGGADFERLCAQIALGRWQEALELGERQKDRNQAERAMALIGLNRPEEARALLIEGGGGDVIALRALLELRLPTGAEPAAMFRQALGHGVSRHFKAQLVNEPVFRALIEEADTLNANAAGLGERAEALAPTSIDVSTSQALPDSLPTRLLAAPQTAQADLSPELSHHAARGGDGRFFAGHLAQRNHVIVCTPGQPNRVFATLQGTIRGLAVTRQGLVVVAHDVSLTLLDAAGAVLSSLTLTGIGDTLAVDGDGERVAVSIRGSVTLVHLEQRALVFHSSFMMPNKAIVTSLGFATPTRLIVSGNGMNRTALVDVANLSQPRFVSVMHSGLEVLHAGAGHAVVTIDGVIHCLAVGDALTSLWHVEVERSRFAEPLGGGRFVLAAAGELSIVDPASGAVERTKLIDGGGSMLELRGFELRGSTLIAVDERGPVALDEHPLGVPALEQAIVAARPKVKDVLTTHLQALIESGVGDEPFGGALLRWSNGSLEIGAVPPRSVTCLGHPRRMAFEVQSIDAPARAENRQQEFGQHLSRDLELKLKVDALSALAREVMAELAPKTKTRALITAVFGLRGIELVEVSRGGGEVGPLRAKNLEVAVKSLGELMSSRTWYESIESWVLRARRDLAFRAEVLALLATARLPAANRVAVRVVDVDLEGCSRAWLAAAEQDVAFALEGLMELHKRGNSTATAKLTALAENDDPDLALPARRALGRSDEDRTVWLITKRLESLDEYDDERVPAKALAALSEHRIVQLKEALLAAKSKLVRPHTVLHPLIRAGWVPDEAAISLGNTERAQEDDFMSTLFSEDEPDAAATAVRSWLAREIATRLDGDGSVWPDGMPLEQARVAWQRFFTLAWPEWERLGVLEKLHAVLPAKAAASKPVGSEKLGADARFALQLLHQNVLRAEPRGPAFAEALKEVPYEEKARADVLRMAKLSRVQFGWSLLKAKRFAEARRVANAAMADGGDDGQVAFFDARVAWLEKDDPLVAIPRIEAALERAADGVGRARLLNLYGAVFDAMREYSKALEWFHKALTVSDAPSFDHATGESSNDPNMTHSILSNIAEAHWNLGQEAEARHFAQQASHRGSNTDIVKTILAAAGPADGGPSVKLSRYL